MGRKQNGIQLQYAISCAATAGTLQANINITKPKPVRVLHAAPIALLRDEKTSTGHDRVSSSTPHQELQLSYTKLISKLLCLLIFHKAAGLDVAASA